LLKLAREKSLTIKTIDLRNSGDTAGDKSRVVGYGAYVIGIKNIKTLLDVAKAPSAWLQTGRIKS